MKSLQRIWFIVAADVGRRPGTTGGEEEGTDTRRGGGGGEPEVGM